MDNKVNKWDEVTMVVSDTALLGENWTAYLVATNCSIVLYKTLRE